MVACLGASASFIGLLFVGLSVVLQKTTDNKLADSERILAESSYASLINIFFVTLVGTLPSPSIGYVSTILALVGLLSCWRLMRYSHVVPLIISSMLYVVELAFGLWLITHPSRYLNVSLFATIIMALFGISLVRAWGLTGIRENRSKK
jgi:ABC-type Fe3+-siderophore transport system permease subunit